MLASSRATQLTPDTTEDGQLSPFTAQLVRGLRDAEADEYLTVTDLYRQVRRWVTDSSGLVPQPQFSGEGEVIIARGAAVPVLRHRFPRRSPNRGRPWSRARSGRRSRTSARKSSSTGGECTRTPTSSRWTPTSARTGRKRGWRSPSRTSR